MSEIHVIIISVATSFIVANAYGLFLTTQMERLKKMMESDMTGWVLFICECIKMAKDGTNNDETSGEEIDDETK